MGTLAILWVILTNFSPWMNASYYYHVFIAPTHLHQIALTNIITDDIIIIIMYCTLATHRKLSLSIEVEERMENYYQWWGRIVAGKGGQDMAGMSRLCVAITTNTSSMWPIYNSGLAWWMWGLGEWRNWWLVVSVLGRACLWSSITSKHWWLIDRRPKLIFDWGSQFLGHLNGPQEISSIPTFPDIVCLLGDLFCKHHLNPSSQWIAYVLNNLTHASKQVSKS